MMGTEATKEENNGVIYTGTDGDGCTHFILRIGRRAGNNLLIHLHTYMNLCFSH